MLRTPAGPVIGVPAPRLQSEGHGDGMQAGTRSLGTGQPRAVGPTRRAWCAWRPSSQAPCCRTQGAWCLAGGAGSAPCAALARRVQTTSLVLPLSHGPVLAAEPRCSNAHIPATAFAGAQPRLLRHGSRMAVLVSQRSHGGLNTGSPPQGGEHSSGWRTKRAAPARAVQQSLGNRLPASLHVHGGQGKAQGPGGSRVLQPLVYQPGESGCV